MGGDRTRLGRQPLEHAGARWSSSGTWLLKGGPPAHLALQESWATGQWCAGDGAAEPPGTIRAAGISCLWAISMSFCCVVRSTRAVLASFCGVRPFPVCPRFPRTRSGTGVFLRSLPFCTTCPPLDETPLTRHHRRGSTTARVATGQSQSVRPPAHRDSEPRDTRYGFDRCGAVKLDTIWYRGLVGERALLGLGAF